MGRKVNAFLKDSDYLQHQLALAFAYYHFVLGEGVFLWQVPKQFNISQVTIGCQFPNQSRRKFISSIRFRIEAEVVPYSPHRHQISRMLGVRLNLLSQAFNGALQTV